MVYNLSLCKLFKNIFKKISFSFQLYIDGVPRGYVFPDSTQAISASGLKGGRSYEVAVVVFPVNKDEYKVAMSNLLVIFVFFILFILKY